MRIPLSSIGTELTNIPQNIEASQNKEYDLLEYRKVVHEGWGQKYIDRVHTKGKMTTQERISYLIDDDSSYFEVGTLVNWGRKFDKRYNESEF